MSGASIGLAALLLIIPGFFTDFFGFLLLIPVTRKILLNIAIKTKKDSDFKDNQNIIDGEVVDKKKDEL